MVSQKESSTAAGSTAVPGRRIKYRLGIAVTAVTMAMIAAACGSAANGAADSASSSEPVSSQPAGDSASPESSQSDTSAGDAGSTDSGAASSDGGVAAAKKIVDEAMKPASGWQGPSDAPTPKAGARVAIVSANQAAEGTAIIAEHMERAGAALGWKTTVFDGQGDPSVQLKAINSAVDSKFDGIVLDIIDTRVVQEGVQRAIAAKIPLITLGALVNEPESVPDVSHDWVRAGQLAAYYMIANSPDGKANVLILADFEFPAVKIGEYKGIMSVLSDKSQCTNCTITEKQFLSKDIATQPGQLATAQIQEDPETNWVWCFDACMQAVATQVLASGITTKAHGVGMNGLPGNLNLIEQGRFQTATIGNPYPFETWATMDNLNRLMNGEPVYDWAKALPLRIIDQTNVGDLSQNDRKIGWIGDVDYEAEFKKLWGVTG
jgi:ribose transport system substrate-binding protein